MARNNSCDKCTVWKDDRGYHHDPKCPEMFWPDGRPRGYTAGIDLRDYPFKPDLRIENSGGTSPISLAMGKIFAGVGERMLRDHIAAQKYRKELEDLVI